MRFQETFSTTLAFSSRSYGIVMVCALALFLQKRDQGSASPALFAEPYRLCLWWCFCTMGQACVSTRGLVDDSLTDPEKLKQTRWAEPAGKTGKTAKGGKPTKNKNNNSRYAPTLREEGICAWHGPGVYVHCGYGDVGIW